MLVSLVVVSLFLLIYVNVIVIGKLDHKFIVFGEAFKRTSKYRLLKQFLMFITLLLMSGYMFWLILCGDQDFLRKELTLSIVAMNGVYLTYVSLKNIKPGYMMYLPSLINLLSVTTLILIGV